VHPTPTACASHHESPANAPAELDDIVATRCQVQDHEVIDNALRSYLNVTTSYKCMPPAPRCLRARSVDRG
jgi:hypothetical protein